MSRIAKPRDARREARVSVLFDGARRSFGTVAHTTSQWAIQCKQCNGSQVKPMLERMAEQDFTFAPLMRRWKHVDADRLKCVSARQPQAIILDTAMPHYFYSLLFMVSGR